MAGEETIIKIPGIDKTFRLVQAIVGIEFPPKLRKIGLRELSKRLTVFAGQLTNEGVVKEGRGTVERSVGRPVGRPPKNAAPQPDRRAVAPRKIRTRLPSNLVGELPAAKRGPGRPRQIKPLSPPNGMDPVYQAPMATPVATPSESPPT